MTRCLKFIVPIYCNMYEMFIHEVFIDVFKQIRGVAQRIFGVELQPSRLQYYWRRKRAATSSFKENCSEREKPKKCLIKGL